MKYTVEGFSQREAVNLGLDANDLCILRWIVDFYNTDKMMKMQIDDKIYFWVKYENIIEDLPILGLKTRDALYRRMKKLVMCNVLEHTTLKQGGTFSMYRIGSNYTRLVNDEKSHLSDEKSHLSDEKSEGYGRKVGGGTDEKSEQNINLLNNKSIKDTGSVEHGSTIPIYDIISYLNQKADTNFRASSKDTQKHIIARWNDGYRLDDFIRVIDAKVKEWKYDKKMAPYLRPSTLFGTKFESYLQQYKEPQKKASNDGSDLARNEDGSLVTF